MQHLIEKGLAVLDDVLGLFYPRICAGCDARLLKQEREMCLICLNSLPKTYFWDYEINPVEKLFWGRLEVSSACSFLHFETGNVVQRLMHRFKYKGKSIIGFELGRSFGYILVDKKWFSDIDYIIPIPLHRTKQIRRGYNQSKCIADGLAEVYGVPVKSKILERTIPSSTQTKKSRFERAENVDEIFRVIRSELVKGKNILLVDDVVTTGATLVAAGKVLSKAGVGRLYVATIAVA